MGLQNPAKKMSKSENDYISLLEDKTLIQQKILRAETDSENKIYYDPAKKPGVSNLLVIYALLKKMTVQEAERELVNLNYHQLKKELAELVELKLQIIQQNFSFYQSKVKDLLVNNQIYLQKIAQEKIKKIKNQMRLIH